jgi:Uma2 family endonuclease
MEAVISQPLTDYEIERGKPMPSFIHALIQKRLLVLLDNRYGSRFEILSELSLDTPGERTTPDIAICEIQPIDFSRDEIKRKEPPFATIEILSPTQILQMLIDKTQDYFSFGVKSCWIVIPALQSVYVFTAPNRHEVFTPGEELYDANLDIRVPMDVIFAQS